MQTVIRELELKIIKIVTFISLTFMYIDIIIIYK